MQKILILNDHFDLLEGLEMILFHRGYYVISNVSLSDLPAVISKHQPDLMILYHFSSRAEVDSYFDTIQSDPYANCIPLLVIARENEVFNGFAESKNNYFIPKQLNTKDLIDTIENLLKTRY